MRTDEELLKTIGAMNAGSNAPTYETAKAELVLKCVNNVVDSIIDLNNSIKQNSISNDAISKKIFWLNVVLTAATLIGSIAAAILAYRG
jgi:hypothetical protein